MNMYVIKHLKWSLIGVELKIKYSIVSFAVDNESHSIKVLWFCVHFET